jgi:hypothetical protein
LWSISTLWCVTTLGRSISGSSGFFGSNSVKAGLISWVTPVLIGLIDEGWIETGSSGGGFSFSHCCFVVGDGLSGGSHGALSNFPGGLGIVEFLLSFLDQF